MSEGNDALTDVNGILVSQYADVSAACGVTVVLCPDGAVAGVNIRSAAPGTRETDLLTPVNLRCPVFLPRHALRH